MTNEPEQSFGGVEYPSLEQSSPTREPFAPVDYPTAYPPLPPPVYQQRATGYPPPYPGYPTGYPAPYHSPADPYGPYGAYRQGKPLGTNGKAVASLVTSLIGMLLCGLPSLVGLILGIIAMRETRKTGQDGYGLALAGTVIGGVVAAMWTVVLFLWMLGMVLAASTVTGT